MKWGWICCCWSGKHTYIQRGVETLSENFVDRELMVRKTRKKNSFFACEIGDNFCVVWNQILFFYYARVCDFFHSDKKLKIWQSLLKMSLNSFFSPHYDVHDFLLYCVKMMWMRDNLEELFMQTIMNFKRNSQNTFELKFESSSKY